MLKKLINIIYKSLGIDSKKIEKDKMFLTLLNVFYYKKKYSIYL